MAIRITRAFGVLTALACLAGCNAQSGEIRSIGRMDATLGQTTQPVLIRFYAPGCGFCEKLARTLEPLKREYAGKVSFYQVDGVESPEMVRKYLETDQLKPPTVAIYQAGQRRKILIGSLPASRYRKALDPLLAEADGSKSP